MTNDERLRRIGDLLLKGVYLWAEATESRDRNVRGGSDQTTVDGGGPRRPAMRAAPSVGSNPGGDLANAHGREHGLLVGEHDGRNVASTLPIPPVPRLTAPPPLDDFAAAFDDLFATPAQRRGFRAYLCGLLTPHEGPRTLATLADAGFAGGALSVRMQRLQYFLCEAEWDADVVAERRRDLTAVAPKASLDDGSVLVKLGWDDVMVRSERGIRRHRELVSCALAFWVLSSAVDHHSYRRKAPAESGKGALPRDGLLLHARQPALDSRVNSVGRPADQESP